MTAAAGRSVILRATNLEKRYAAVHALKSANLTLHAGEVHALMGANGAGKSTLVKILTGAVAPDTGEVTVDGVSVPLGNPRSSLAAGIACIYQESNLVPAMSVLDNVTLGAQPTKTMGIVDRRRQRRDVEALLERHGIKLDVDAAVQSLPTVQQKQVEIAKALAREARVILMDEPTAWLSQVEVRHLFRSIRTLTEQGIAVLYISHVLDEVFAIADVFTVVRDGAIVVHVDRPDVTPAALVQAMLGRELSAEAGALRATQTSDASRPALELRGLTEPGAFYDVDLAVHAGEIVCLTGLIGAGRTELVSALFGVGSTTQGDVLIHGRPTRIRRPASAIRAGLGLVPEDRRIDGLMMDHSVRSNVIAAHLGRVTSGGVLRRRRVRQLAESVVESVGIVPPRTDVPVRTLSGGNQQKVLIGRWLTGDTDILLLDEPTVGIDVGAKAEIYQRLRAIANDGTAVLVISSDMEEVLSLPDRIVVMAAGRVVATFPKHEATQDAILAAASVGVG